MSDHASSPAVLEFLRRFDEVAEGMVQAFQAEHEGTTPLQRAAALEGLAHSLGYLTELFVGHPRAMAHMKRRIDQGARARVLEQREAYLEEGLRRLPERVPAPAASAA